VNGDGAKEFLGLYADATPEQIEIAYTKRGSRLKRRIIQAKSVALREKARRALKNLVVVRDLALGPRAARARRRAKLARRIQDARKDDWAPELGVPRHITSRTGALRFFGLGRHASPELVNDVFHARSRVLKARIAHAANNTDLLEVQQALAHLNILYQLALTQRMDKGLRVFEAEPPAPEDGVDLMQEGTMTDDGATFHALPPSDAEAPVGKPAWYDDELSGESTLGESIRRGMPLPSPDKPEPDFEIDLEILPGDDDG